MLPSAISATALPTATPRQSGTKVTFLFNNSDKRGAIGAKENFAS